MGPEVGGMYWAVFVGEGAEGLLSRKDGTDKERQGRTNEPRSKTKKEGFSENKRYVHTNSPNLFLSPTKQIPILSSLANALCRPHFSARCLTWVLVSGGGCGGWVCSSFSRFT